MFFHGTYSYIYIGPIVKIYQKKNKSRVLKTPASPREPFSSNFLVIPREGPGRTLKLPVLNFLDSKKQRQTKKVGQAVPDLQQPRQRQKQTARDKGDPRQRPSGMTAYKMSFVTSPSKMFSTLICQNQTSLHRKLSVAYVCRTVRSTASTQAKVGAKWEDFGKWLVKKAHSLEWAKQNIARMSFITT